MTPASTHRLSFENRRPHGISTTEGRIVMKSILLGATVLMGLSAPAWAVSFNEISIDAGTAGSVRTLSITQDTANPSNQVSKTSAGGSTLPVKGTWDTISIDQQGGANAFNGSLAADSTSTTATLTASYAGGNNTHSLKIGTRTTPPVNPSVQIAVTGGGSNTITDTLDGNTLKYNLAIAGTGNFVTNDVSASGAVALNQGGSDGSGGNYGITGSFNTVSNTASGGVTSFTHNLSLTGDNNSITNLASGAATKTFTQTIQSSGNTIVMNLDSGDAQTGALTVGNGSMVNYNLHASAIGAQANVTLSNVVGAGGTTPAVIQIIQTSSAIGATANIIIDGGGSGSPNTMGTLAHGSGPGADVAGVYVSQSTPNLVLDAIVAGASNGYTARFVQ
jgi:hypothetical protein